MSDQSVIHDIGYQRYDGPRLGRWYAVRSLYVHGLRAAYGLGRTGKGKVFPWIVVGIVSLVAAVLATIRAQAPIATELLANWEFPNAVVILVLLFCAVIAPELVTRDLRGAVLPLYFSRPITRVDYALAKLAAMVSAVFLLLAGPILLLTLGAVFTVEADQVMHELGEFGKGLAVAACYALVFGALSILLASLARRRAIASAVIVAAFLVTTPVYGVLMGLAYSQNGDGTLTGSGLKLSQLAGLVSPMQVANGIGEWWWGAAEAVGPYGPLYGLVALGLTVLSLGFLLLRYRKVAR